MYTALKATSDGLRDRVIVLQEHIEATKKDIHKLEGKYSAEKLVQENEAAKLAAFKESQVNEPGDIEMRTLSSETREEFDKGVNPAQYPPVSNKYFTLDVKEAAEVPLPDDEETITSELHSTPDVAPPQLDDPSAQMLDDVYAFEEELVEEPLVEHKDEAPLFSERGLFADPPKGEAASSATSGRTTPESVSSSGSEPVVSAEKQQEMKKEVDKGREEVDKGREPEFLDPLFNPGDDKGPKV